MIRRSSSIHYSVMRVSLSTYSFVELADFSEMYSCNNPTQWLHRLPKETARNTITSIKEEGERRMTTDLTCHRESWIGCREAILQRVAVNLGVPVVTNPKQPVYRR